MNTLHTHTRAREKERNVKKSDSLLITYIFGGKELHPSGHLSCHINTVSSSEWRGLVVPLRPEVVQEVPITAVLHYHIQHSCV